MCRGGHVQGWTCAGVDMCRGGHVKGWTCEGVDMCGKA